LEANAAAKRRNQGFRPARVNNFETVGERI
jgi:hypothetical protein